MTEEEIDRYVNLSTTFPYFLQELGLDPAHPLILKLFEKHSYIEAHTEEERAIVKAWAAWSLEYQRNRTTIWYTKNIEAKINEMRLFKMPDGHMGDPPEPYYHNRLNYDAGCVLRVKQPHDMIRGLGVFNLIIEDIDPESETYAKLWELRPCVMGSFITIW